MCTSCRGGEARRAASPLFPLQQDAQVNGFKSHRIAGLLVDFLPNRVGVIPPQPPVFPLQTETGGGRTRRLLPPRVTPVKLTTKRAAAAVLYQLFLTHGSSFAPSLSPHDFNHRGERLLCLCVILLSVFSVLQ